MLHCMARRNFAGKQQENDSTTGVNSLGSTSFGSAAPNSVQYDMSLKCAHIKTIRSTQILNRVTFISPFQTMPIIF